jgi:hypothetical protein
VAREAEEGLFEPRRAVPRDIYGKTFGCESTLDKTDDLLFVFN